MSTYYKGSLEPLGTFLPVGIETLGYLLPQPGVKADKIIKKRGTIYASKMPLSPFIS